MKKKLKRFIKKMVDDIDLEKELRALAKKWYDKFLYQDAFIYSDTPEKPVFLK
jgi:hypothetical protein